MSPSTPDGIAARARRPLWLAAGLLWLALGIAGVVLPLVPTVDCIALAAFCFARGDRRWEAWLLAHPKFGPALADWRSHRALTMRAKCLATLSMTASCAWAAATLPARTGWIPAAICTLVAVYLWTRPTRRIASCKHSETTRTAASRS